MSSARSSTCRAASASSAGRHDIAAAKHPDLAHQIAGRWIDQREQFRVGHRHGEACPLQQRAIVPQIGEGRDMRARAAVSSASASIKASRSSCRERLPSAAPRNSPSGAKRAADLDQRAGQIVDPMQRQPRDDEIEAIASLNGSRSSSQATAGRGQRPRASARSRHRSSRRPAAAPPRAHPSRRDRRQGRAPAGIRAGSP